MRFSLRFLIGVSVLVISLVACTHADKAAAPPPKVIGKVPVEGMAEIKAESPILLRLKADQARVEKVAYSHRSRSTSYEDVEVRHQKEESLDFVSQAETLKVDDGGDRFTQVITVVKKEGVANLHEFAMPEPGEKLDLTADSRGRILRAGDYPNNSIFFVPPVSLPEGAVNVGDTWPMQAAWLSLGEMVPYQLAMVSIFKRLWACGSHRCAELEIAGEVALQGPLVKMMAFKSMWRGFVLFDIDAGTVVWSRVDSEEQFMSGNVRRSVTSCLEANLIEPVNLRVPQPGSTACSNLAAPGDIAPTPSPTSLDGQ